MTRRDVFSRWAALERALGGRIGAAHPSDEPLRFVAGSALSFPAIDAEPSDDARRWTTHFASLAGSASELPPYLAEELAHEEPDRAPRRALLAPFHQRATSLLYRAVMRARIAEQTRSLDDRWPLMLAAMVGADAAAEDDRALTLALAALLHGPRSASSLSRALAIVSERRLGGVPITLEQRSARRASIAARDRARLGSVRLGDDALLGGSVLDPSARATIRIGPIDAVRARELVDDERATRALEAVGRWFGADAVDLDVTIDVDEQPCVLGRAALGEGTLGRSARRTRSLKATRRASDREPKHATSASGEPAHASRSAFARQEAHSDGSPSPRERGDERRARAAR